VYPRCDGPDHQPGLFLPRATAAGSSLPVMFVRCVAAASQDPLRKECAAVSPTTAHKQRGQRHAPAMPLTQAQGYYCHPRSAELQVRSTTGHLPFHTTTHLAAHPDRPSRLLPPAECIPTTPPIPPTTQTPAVTRHKTHVVLRRTTQAGAAAGRLTSAMPEGWAVQLSCTRTVHTQTTHSTSPLCRL
jgi:hypothetical protein